MKQIVPYTSFQEAIQSFDNGGTIFNLFSHAKDGVVSPAELGKVAGVAHDHQTMILYMVMAISRLDKRSKERILARLDAELFDLYEKYRPVHMSLDEMATRGKAGISTTIVGTPKKISTTTEFSGSIMVPLIVDTVTSFSVVPILTTYDVYELRSDDGLVSVTVAHHKEKSPLPERKLRLGGMLTSLNHSDDAQKSAAIFLEVQYFLEED